MDCDISFNELRCKDVVNTVNGKRLGRAVDIIIDLNRATVLGLVLPGEKKIFKACDDLFIPWSCIIKMGDDVILVKINESERPSIPSPKE